MRIIPPRIIPPTSTPAGRSYRAALPPVTDELVGTTIAVGFPGSYIVYRASREGWSYLYTVECSLSRIDNGA